MTTDTRHSPWRRRACWAGLALVLQGFAVMAYLRIERARSMEQDVAFRYERLGGETAVEGLLSRPDGTTRPIADFRGRPVLLHVWATWCPPCRDELPALLETARGLAREGRLELVAVSLDEDWAVLREFFAGEIPPGIYRDADGQVSAGCGISSLPETFLLDREGKLALRFAGSREWRTPAALDVLRHHTAEPGP